VLLTRTFNIFRYESNIKLFFEKENIQFARGVAKWLCMSDPEVLNIQCVKLNHSENKIILCTTDTHNLSKKERWGDLYIEPKNKKNVDELAPKTPTWTGNITVEMYQQFKWVEQITSVCNGPAVLVKDICMFDTIGKNTIKLFYRNDPYSNDYGADILRRFSAFLQKNVVIYGRTLVEYMSYFVRTGGDDKYYVVGLEVITETPTESQKTQNVWSNLFTPQKLDELDEILKDYVQENTIEYSSIDLDKEQENMQQYFATEVSLVIK